VRRRTGPLSSQVPKCRDPGDKGFVPLGEHSWYASQQHLPQTRRRRSLRSSPACPRTANINSILERRRTGASRRAGTSTFTPVRGGSVLRRSGRANHRDPVTPPHLPCGKAGSGLPPGRKFQQWIDTGEPAGVRCPANPNRREVLGEHQAAREPRSSPAAVSLPRRQRAMGRVRRRRRHRPVPGPRPPLFVPGQAIVMNGGPGHWPARSSNGGTNASSSNSPIWRHASP
jgi:hypothetical protein